MSPENTQQDALWYEAQRWLWHQRRHARPGAGIRHLRFHRQTEDESLWRRVQEGSYRLTPMQVFRGADGKGPARRSSPDAPVLKWCALHTGGRLPVHDRCEHRRGNGGYVASVRKVREAPETEAYRYVFRTGIRGYYRNIRKKQLWLQVSRFVADRRLLALTEQYLWYSVEDGGEFRTPEKGIPGAAL